MKLLSIFLCFIGSVLIYGSHVNQQIFKSTLTKPFFSLGVVLICVSLPLMIYILPKLVAVYMWLATMTVAWSFIPMLPLLRRFIPHEIFKSAKDST